jgi:hypothetical protein
MAFRYSSAAGDANFQAITRGAAGQTVTDTGIAVAADTVYKLRLRFDELNDVAYFSINNSGDIAVTLTLPTAGVFMGWENKIINVAAGARSCKFANLKGRTT